ncbi:phosphatase [Roseobacter cerasinus]|uniref:phosphoglycolate phosphatase n=1 Tax=Roseobacter cerasinus TaxID=2602289 RepID=A0A640VR98_9RHOB|nr:phosphatase [Roseobacter cerasinus]
MSGVLFDKDGTLFDFAATWEAWCKRFLDQIADDSAHATRLAAAIGFDYAAGQFMPGSVVVAGTPDQIAKTLLPDLPDLAEGDLIDIMNTAAAEALQVPAVPLAPLLGELRGRGLCLGVATNDAEAPARAHLDQAGVTDYFDFIAGFDSGYGGKPDAGQLLAFAAAVGHPPAALVMVGDSTHDLIAGRAAGMRCVGVLTGVAGRAELDAYAEAVFDDISALPAWIEAQSLT